MPRKFAFTATEELGELQLGGYDPASVAQPMKMFPMAVLPSSAICVLAFYSPKITYPPNIILPPISV